MKKDDILFSKDNAVAFCNEVCAFFFASPYGSIPKTDLQEYLLYLIDAYSQKGLLALSDPELEVLLKVSLPRVRSIRANIALKYAPAYECTNENLLRHLMALPGNSFSFDNDSVTVIIGDALVRDHLEHVLRTVSGATFDYKRNSTIVEIKYDLFFRTLDRILPDAPSGDEKALQANLAKIKKDHYKAFALKAADYVLDKATNLAGAISGIIGALPR